MFDKNGVVHRVFPTYHCDDVLGHRVDNGGGLGGINLFAGGGSVLAGLLLAFGRGGGDDGGVERPGPEAVNWSHHQIASTDQSQSQHSHSTVTVTVTAVTEGELVTPSDGKH